MLRSCSVRCAGVLSPSPSRMFPTWASIKWPISGKPDIGSGEGQGGGWPRMPHSVVARRQRQRAESLRRDLTAADTLLWRYLKVGRLDGLSFRRSLQRALLTIRDTARSRFSGAPPSLSLPRKGGGNPQTADCKPGELSERERPLPAVTARRIEPAGTRRRHR